MADYTDPTGAQFTRTTQAFNTLAARPEPWKAERAKKLIAADELEAAAAALLAAAAANRERAARSPETASPQERAPRDVNGQVHVYAPAMGMSFEKFQNKTGITWSEALDSTGKTWKVNAAGDWWTATDPANPQRPKDYPTNIEEPIDPENPPLENWESLNDLPPEAFPVYRMR